MSWLRTEPLRTEKDGDRRLAMVDKLRCRASALRPNTYPPTMDYPALTADLLDEAAAYIEEQGARIDKYADAIDVVSGVK